MGCDFLRDILQRCIEAAQRDDGFSDEWARDIEAQIRKDWGGERVYIGKTADDARIEISRRNAAIIRDMNSGERVGLIARRHKISRRMVYKLWDAYLLDRRKV